MSPADPVCDDCGDWDMEWMNECKKHRTQFCRGCSCPECLEEASDLEDGDPNACPRCHGHGDVLPSPAAEMDECPECHGSGLRE